MTMTDARDLTLTLGGRWYGRYGAAPCPVCQPERRKGQNALTLANGRNGLLAHCKEGACAFLDILATAGLRSGDYRPPDPATRAQRDREAKAEAEKRAAQAKRLWQEAQPITGTLAETYLRGRGITCPLPPVLRFHPDCWHGPTAKRYPAMVGAVQGAGLPALHRTYLRADGSGKADIEPARAMLGALCDSLGGLRGWWWWKAWKMRCRCCRGFWMALRRYGRGFQPRACAGCSFRRNLHG